MDHGRTGSRAGAEGEEALITPHTDGPLVVRGPFRIIDEDGHEIPARRATVALCRCGKSRIRPFCDGTHKLTGFSAPSGADPAR
jgi:CDGSH-type Zn-finger protein